MIRILHIFGSMRKGGIDSVIMNIIRDIDREKYECSLLLSSDVNEYVDELASLGIKVFTISGNNFRELNRAFRAFFTRHKSDFDIAHIHFMHPKCYYIARAAKKGGLKTIVHSHLQGKEFGVVYRLCRFLLNRCTDAKIACSADAGDYMFGKNKDVCVYKNSIRTERFLYSREKALSLREKYGLSGRFVVGHIGRFAWQKNHVKLLSVFEEVRKRNPNAVLLLIGWGELEKEVQDLAEHSVFRRDIVFLPPSFDVNAYYHLMDIFVLPSHLEGLPMVLIEAQANGLKCFVSDTVSSEVRVTGQLEFIDLTKSHEEWAEAILNSPHERRDVLLQLIENGFDNKTNVKSMERIYSDIMEVPKK